MTNKIQWGWRVRSKPSKYAGDRPWHWQADEPTGITAENCEYVPVFVDDLDAPSSQSVVVPVDAERVLDAAAAYLRKQYGASHGLDHPIDRRRILSSIPSAPVPSSLAGGEVRARLIETLKRIDDGIYDCLNDQADAILAALSPEAPAREGVAAKPLDWRKPTETTGHETCELIAPGLGGFYGLQRDADHWVVWQADDEYAFWKAETREAAIAKAESDWQRVFAAKALTPRHEAPAEGAGERESLADAYIAGAMSVHEYWTENPGEAPRGDPEFDEAAGDYAYSILSDLRARSSAPEALGNLLAVIHRDGGHRTLEVGVEQAAAEAEKIVANLLSSAPEAREGEAVAWRYKAKFSDLAHSHWHYTDRDPSAAKTITNVQPLYAAPSADKLRIAVETLERIAHEPRPVTRAAMREYAAEALAALKGDV